MRKALFAAVSAAVLAAALPAAASASPSPAAVQATAPDAVSDGELRSFAAAMEAVRPIADETQGAAPTADQQARMAAAIEASGLALDRFNAISTAVSADPVVRARAELAALAPSAAGSVAAGVTDAEVAQYSVAMQAVQPIAESLNGAAPDAEQQARMAEAIAASGLALERFNAISGAVSRDAYLRGRLAVADARRQG